MQRETKRRAVLGGLAVAGVGATGYLLRPAKPSEPPVRYLGPSRDISTSDTFAYVGGVAPDGETMAVEVAMRQTAYDRREIELFHDTDRPVESAIPGLRSFWRFEASVAGRDPGEYRLVVDGETVSVTLETDLPERFRDPRLELTARGLWQTAVAHAYAYDTGADTGRLHVALREPAGSGPGALDRVDFLTPDGTVIGGTKLPEGDLSAAFRLDPFEPYDRDGVLRGYRDGTVVDKLDMFYS